MKNTLPDLRDHLFETIERLKEGDIDIATANAINGVAQTLVASAKVEVDFHKITDHNPEKSFFARTDTLSPLKLSAVGKWQG